MDKLMSPPDCVVCGAKPLANHAKDCAYLSVLKTAAYPRILDDNGREWQDNLIDKLKRENEVLRNELRIAKELILKEVHKRACNYIDKSYGHRNHSAEIWLEEDGTVGVETHGMKEDCFWNCIKHLLENKDNMLKQQ